eukprot:scpid45355/ scgid8447/ 
MRNVGAGGSIMSILFPAIILTWLISCGLVTLVVCQETADGGEDESGSRADLPGTTVQQPNNTVLHAALGSSVQLICYVTLNGSIVWRTPRSVSSGRSFLISTKNGSTHKTSTANIRHVSSWHAGLYTCALGNGVVLRNFTLFITPDARTGFGSLLLYGTLGCVVVSLLGASLLARIHQLRHKKPKPQLRSSYSPGRAMLSDNVVIPGMPDATIPHLGEQHMSPPPAAPPRPASSLEARNQSLYSSNYQALRGVKHLLHNNADGLQAADTALINSPKSWRSTDTGPATGRSKQRIDNMRSTMSYFKSADIDDGLGYHDLSASFGGEDYLPPADTGFGSSSYRSTRQSRHLSQQGSARHSESTWCGSIHEQGRPSRVGGSCRSNHWSGASAKEMVADTADFDSRSSSTKSHGNPRRMHASDVPVGWEHDEMDDLCDIAMPKSNSFASHPSPVGPLVARHAGGRSGTRGTVTTHGSLRHSHGSRITQEHCSPRPFEQAGYPSSSAVMSRTTSLQDTKPLHVGTRTARMSTPQHYSQVSLRNSRMNTSLNPTPSDLLHEHTPPLPWRPDSAAGLYRSATLHDEPTPAASPTPLRHGHQDFAMSPRAPRMYQQ